MICHLDTATAFKHGPKMYTYFQCLEPGAWSVGGSDGNEGKFPPHHNHVPSRELRYPPEKSILKMIFLFPRWDMLISWEGIAFIPSFPVT